MSARAAAITFLLCAVFFGLAHSSALWQTQTVDFGGAVGEYASLALDAEDLPYISYYNWSNSSLRCAVASRAGAWIFHNVDVAGNCGKGSSVAVGRGDSGVTIHIAYLDTKARSLKYAVFSDGKWILQTVDSPAESERTSIALDRTGRPRITYSGGRARSLKYAVLDETGAWNIETIDAERCGHYSSLAINSAGEPCVAYWDGAASDLKYARRTASGWKISVVDKEGDVGQCCSMKLDGLGRPHIAYYDYTLKNLKYAHFDGKKWTAQTVDAEGDVGGYCSLALDGDSPRISYWDYTNVALKYASREKGAWRTQMLDSAGEVGGWTFLATDSFGSPHIAYYDFGNRDLKYIFWRDPAVSKTFREKFPPVLLVSSMTFADEDGDGILSAGETGKLSLIVFNAGSGPARAVSAALKHLASGKNSAGDFSFRSAGNVNIKSGASAVIEAFVSAGACPVGGRASFEVRAMEESGFDSEPSRFSVETEPFAPPVLRVRSVEFAETAYVVKNGAIDPGEAIDATVEIENAGSGRARGVRAALSSSSPDIFVASPSAVSLGTFLPRAIKKAVFSFSVSRRYSGPGVLPLNISVDEKRGEYSFVAPAGLALGKKSGEMPEMVFRPSADMPDGCDGRDEVYHEIPRGRMRGDDAVAAIIAVKTYRHADVPAVDYALNDAALVKKYLMTALGYKEGNIIVVEDATKGDFETVFGNRENPRGQLYSFLKSGKSDVFVYYSGHGAPDAETREAYFVPSDCHPNFVRLGGYSCALLYENLAKLPAASVTVIVDACFSGGFHKGALLTKGSPISVVPKSAPASGLCAVLASSAENEISSWYPEKKHGLFTYYFALALKGKAEKNSDRKLTMGEIKDYLDENVSYQARKLFNRSQTPVLSGNRDRVIVEYAK